MITQNPIILTELSNQKLRELRAEGAESRRAKEALHDQAPRIRIAMQPVWLKWVRMWRMKVHLLHRM